MSDAFETTISRLEQDHRRLGVTEKLGLPWDELNELINGSQGVLERIAAVVGDRNGTLACIVKTPHELVLGETRSAPIGLTRIVYDSVLENRLRGKRNAYGINGNAETIAAQYGCDVMSPEHFLAMVQTGLFNTKVGRHSALSYLRAPDKDRPDYAVVGYNTGAVFYNHNPARIIDDLGVRLELVLKR